MSKIIPGPNKPPKNRKYFTTRDLPIEVARQCGCKRILLRGPYSANINRLVHELADVSCLLCQELSELAETETLHGLPKMYKSRERRVERDARYSRLNFYTSWIEEMEDDLKAGLLVPYRTKQRPILEVAIHKKRWRRPGGWTRFENDELGHRSSHWEAEIVDHVVGEALKDRDAFFCRVSDPWQHPVHLKFIRQLVREHVTRPSDCLALVASPNAEVRSRGMALMTELHTRSAEKSRIQAATTQVG